MIPYEHSSQPTSHLTEDLESEEPTELSEGPDLEKEDHARGEEDYENS